jgi:chromosome segregation ATPase
LENAAQRVQLLNLLLKVNATETTAISARISDANRKRNDAQAKLKALKETLAHETRTASEETISYLFGYRQAVKRQQKHLSDQIQQYQDLINKLTDSLRQCLFEKRSFQIPLHSAQLTVATETARTEAKTMDEIALQMHYSSRRKKLGAMRPLVPQRLNLHW